MKKNKILTITLAIAMLTTLLIPGLAALADGDEYTATFGAQMDPVNGWDLGDVATTAFYIGAAATISIDFDETVSFGDGNYIAIETNIPNPYDGLDPFADTGIAQVLSFKLDGNSVDMGDVLINAEGKEAIDGSGPGLRLTLTNKWNGTIEVQPVDPVTLGEFTKLEIEFIVHGVGEAPGGGAGEAPAPAGPVMDPNGEYGAFLGIQMSNWVHRDPWDSARGANGSFWDDVGANYYNNLWNNEDNMPNEGVFTDAEIKGNGTYRVSLDNYDFSTSADSGAESFNQLYVSTNIPLEGNPLTITNVKVIIGGRERHVFDEAVIEGIDTKDRAEYYKIMAINIWNNDLKDLFNNMVPDEGEIAMEFTISGFAYDNADGAQDDIEEEEPTPMPTPAQRTPDPTPETAAGDGGLPGWVIPVIIAGAAAVIIVVVVVIVMSKKKAGSGNTEGN